MSSRRRSNRLSSSAALLVELRQPRTNADLTPEPANDGASKRKRCDFENIDIGPLSDGPSDFDQSVKTDVFQSSVKRRKSAVAPQATPRASGRARRLSSKAAALHEPTPKPKVSSPQPVAITTPSDTLLASENEIPEHDFETIRHHVLRKLHRIAPPTLVDLDAEHAKLTTLLTQTITRGESNSLVLVGARGSGKSALLESAIATNKARHGDDFYVVRLNGLIHTDARLAFREIWFQLQEQMSADSTDHRNIADTVTTLLALLSHQGPRDKVTRAVVFVLDEFQLFTTHPRQTLLYNLFDIAQSQKAPVAVIGLTTRLDVAETLEKRVKSRFSHRHIYVPLAKDLDTFMRMCRASLEDNHQLWASVLDRLFADPAMIAHVRDIYHTTKLVPDFQSSMVIPVAQATFRNIFQTLRNPVALQPTTRLAVLAALSSLQLSLIIAAARLHHLLDTDLVSFALVYDEYRTLAANARVRAGATGQGVRLWSTPIALKAWEGLRESRLVLPAVGSNNSGTVSMSKIDVSLDELALALESDHLEADSIMLKWCREGP